VKQLEICTASNHMLLQDLKLIVQHQTNRRHLTG